MILRQIGFASLVTLVLVSFPGSALTAKAGLLSYCRADAERLCPGVPPGGGRIVACLKAHKLEVSVGCAKAVQKIKAEVAQ